MRDKSEILNEIKTRQKLRCNDHLMKLLYGLERDTVMENKKVRLFDEGGYIDAIMCSSDTKEQFFNLIKEDKKEEIKTLNISTLWNDLEDIKERLSVVEKRTTKNFSRSYTSCYLYEVMKNPSIFMDREKLLELFPIEDRIEYLQDQIRLNVNNFDKEAKEEYYKYLLNILKSINDGSLT